MPVAKQYRQRAVRIDRVPTAEKMHKLIVGPRIVDSASKKVVYHDVLKLTLERKSFVTPVISLKNGSYKVTKFSFQSEDSNSKLNDGRIVILPALFTVN